MLRLRHVSLVGVVAKAVTTLAVATLTAAPAAQAAASTGSKVIFVGNNPDIGSAEVSENGRTVVPKHSRAAMPTASNYLKQGLYRDKVDSLPAILWHDNLRVTAP